MRRRQFVLGGLSAGLGAGALPALARAPAKTTARAAIPFGAAMRVDLLRDDPDYRRAVLEHCQVLVGEGGLKIPIQVRRDEAQKRYVLVAGLHRLEAMRSLGEASIDALIVAARKF